jgi:hypothetical protein
MLFVIEAVGKEPRYYMAEIKKGENKDAATTASIMA